jgi:copper transport outer membrane protein MctB
VIDFRYHLVSILAIFLALGLGLVLGATALSDPLLGELKTRTGSLAKDNEDLRDQAQTMESQLKGDEQFTLALAPQVLADRLKGQSVVVVMTPGANDQIRGEVATMVQEAGATYTGQVTINSKFVADDQLAVLDALVSSIKPADVTFPVEATPYDRAAAVLASALVTDQETRAGREDASGGEILAGFRDQGFLTISGKPGARATLAVMIAPSTLTAGKTADADNKALISLATALDKADRGTVMAGTPEAAVDGGLIRVLRESDAAGTISTVDTAGTASGQVVTVLALAQELAGKSGKYGIGSGVNGYVPTPVPSAGSRT